MLTSVAKYRSAVGQGPWPFRPIGEKLCNAFDILCNLTFGLPDEYGPSLNFVDNPYQYIRFRYDYYRVLRRKLLDVLAEIENQLRLGAYWNPFSSAAHLELFNIEALPLVHYQH